MNGTANSEEASSAVRYFQGLIDRGLISARPQVAKAGTQRPPPQPAPKAKAKRGRKPGRPRKAKAPLSLTIPSIEEIEGRVAPEVLVITRLVERYFDIPENSLFVKRRYRAIARPRQIAIKLCCELSGLSINRIATQFGLTWAAVLRGNEAVAARCACTAFTRDAVNQLRLEAQRRLSKGAAHEA